MSIGHQRRVYIVMDAAFGLRINDLDLAVPIWIVRSAINDPVVEHLWRTNAGSVTRFDPQDFEWLVDTVDQHHPDWRELDVVGFGMQEAEPALAQFNPGDFYETAQGFLFSRRGLPPP